jgi:hypothetical protein
MRNANRAEQVEIETSGFAPSGRRPKADDPIEEVIGEICGDRRLRRRYDIDLRVQYKVMRRDHVAQTGSGKTVNLSGAGIACEFDQALKPGSAVELAIAWPVLLNSNCPLKLVVTGRVIRSEDGLTAVRMDKYEFRTQGLKTMHAFAGMGHVM